MATVDFDTADLDSPNNLDKNEIAYKTNMKFINAI